MAASNHYAHAASLLPGPPTEATTAQRARCDCQGHHGPPKGMQGQSRLQAQSSRQMRTFIPRAACIKCRSGPIALGHNRTASDVKSRG